MHLLADLRLSADALTLRPWMPVGLSFQILLRASSLCVKTLNIVLSILCVENAYSFRFYLHFSLWGFVSWQFNISLLCQLAFLLFRLLNQIARRVSINNRRVLCSIESWLWVLGHESIIVVYDYFLGGSRLQSIILQLGDICVKRSVSWFGFLELCVELMYLPRFDHHLRCSLWFLLHVAFL